MGYLRGFGTTMASNGGATGGDYHILPMPVVQAPAPPVQNGGITTTPVTPASDPLASIMGLLDGEVMGIPVKYIAIGLAAYFLMKK